jgi:hypothetical protein
MTSSTNHIDPREGVSEMDSGTAHVLGRMESTLDRIDGRLDTHTEKIVEHGVRLTRVESDVGELKATNVHEQRQGMTVRGAITVALCGALASGAISVLITALNSR